MKHIESRSNKAIKHLARLGREKKYRRETGELICEGEKMLFEAVQSKAEVKTVIVNEGKLTESLEALLRRLGSADIYTAEERFFSIASCVDTPQNVVFSCVQPDWGAGILDSVKRAVILDGVQDPGNLGTILRTAEAFALDAVVISEGCVDICSPKVVRSTMGAVFRLPCIRLKIAEAVRQLKACGLSVYAAEPHSDSLYISDADLRSSAVIIGSEGRGISEEALRLCDNCIKIPMSGRAESLNAGVAASIIIYEMTKQEAF